MLYYLEAPAIYENLFLHYISFFYLDHTWYVSLHHSLLSLDCFLSLADEWTGDAVLLSTAGSFARGDMTTDVGFSSGWGFHLHGCFVIVFLLRPLFFISFFSFLVFLYFFLFFSFFFAMEMILLIFVVHSRIFSCLTGAAGHGPPSRFGWLGGQSQPLIGLNFSALQMVAELGILQRSL